MLPVVAVADLHGHPEHLVRLVGHLDRTLGAYTLVTLGDCCDNGPDVPGLLDALIALHAARPGRVVSILGNHDLACLRALGWPGDTPDPAWYARWRDRYWDPGRGTPAAYGAASAADLARAMPARHRRFLEGLPWVHDDGTHVYVHAGLEAGPLAPQVAALAARRLPTVHLHTPPPLRDKALSKVADPTWDRIVVSAHDKGLGAPCFVGPNRLCLSAELDRTGRLYAAVLRGDRAAPVQALLRVDPTGPVTAVPWSQP